MGGLHGNHFAKNSPTKTVYKLPAAFPDELAERMAGTWSAIATMVGI